MPLRIGLITSHDSAAYNDFVDELHQSRYPFEIVLADARVQGLEAEASLTTAFRSLETHQLDVIALVRGGGAKTDLVAFDRELVARAVATCSVPVFVGIGHEIDRSIVDEVCHSSLKTPTACAAALVQRVRTFDDRVSQLATAITTRAAHRLVRADERIARDGRHLARATLASARLHQQVLDTALARVRSAGIRHTGRETQHLGHAVRRLVRGTHELTRGAEHLTRQRGRLWDAARRALAQNERRLAAAETLADALHPDRILARGFSITRTETGAALRGAPSPGDRLITETVDSIIDTRVEATRPKEET